KLEGNVLDGTGNAWGDIPPRDVFLYGDLADDHRHEVKTSAVYQLTPWLAGGLRYPDLQDVNVQLRANLLPFIGQRVELYVDILNVLNLRTTTLVGQNDGQDFDVV